MKKVFVVFLAVVSLANTAKIRRRRRGFEEMFPVGGGLTIGGEDVDIFSSINIPLTETQSFSQGISKFLPIPNTRPVDVEYNQNLFGIPKNFQGIKNNILPVATSNSIEKPVQEPQEYVPPQSQGTAIIPLMPPPATPVNAAASNVPTNSGAVFLGSGSLGVVDLGNGAYALGSGGIGYSNERRQPRPSSQSPLYPPLRATPNLVPAAVPSQAPQTPQKFMQPMFNPFPPQPMLDQNGYEFLRPDRVTFGMPTNRLRRVKTTQAFATPTVIQVQQTVQQPGTQPMPGFGQPIPSLMATPTPPPLQQPYRQIISLM